MKNINISSLQVLNNKLNGGFSSLDENQLNKIKGGTKDLQQDNESCTNGICSGNNSSDCTNKIKCS